MPQPVEDRAADEGLASGGIRAVLDGRRLDLGSLGRNVAGDGGARMDPAVPVGQGGLEQRLRELVERLERTAGTLDAMLDSLAGRASTTAAAGVLAREADHRIRDSLQTVIALLEQQAKRAEAETVRDVLRLVDGCRVGDRRAPG